MAKKKKAKKAAEERDESLEQAAETETEEAAAPAEEEDRPARSRGKRRAVAQPVVEEEEAPPQDEEPPPPAEDDEDPTWWAPHVVLSALVLIGLFGFFGAFNKPLAFLAAHPKGAPEPAHSSEPAAATTAAAHATPPRPTPAGDQGAQQPQQMFGAKHLLVQYKGARRAPEAITRTKDEAKARAAEAQKKAKGGTKFEDLVKDYSDEPGAGARGGDLGKFPKGAMVPAFQAALEKLKPNEISDVVETDFGFHVILRTQ
jgi:hypothetical protein